MRKMDRDQLQLWLMNNKNGLATLSSVTGIGVYTMRRIIQGKREPKQFEQLAIVQATGLSLDTLFPLVSEARKESA